MTPGTIGVPMIAPRKVDSVHLGMAVRTSEVNVVFTTMEGTVKAMRVAASLARATGARVRLIDPRLVRYPLRAAGYALASAPDVSIEECQRSHVVAIAGVPVEVEVYRSGRAVDAVRVALRQHSLVILGGRRSWLPTRTERLQRALEDLGHIVMFVPAS